MVEVMMRSHKFVEAAKKIKFPGFVSAKFDGVPGGYTKQRLVSRQNKSLPGVQWLHDTLAQHIPDGWQIWGEHWHPDLQFEEISGLVRKNQPWDLAGCMLFNCFDMFNPSATFAVRQARLVEWYDNLPEDVRKHFGMVAQHAVSSKEEAYTMLASVEEGWNAKGFKARFEGGMYHAASGLYTLNRSWASLKMVDKITYDLRLVAVVEAVSKTGANLEMAGTLVFEDASGRKLNVGPGKLKHDERRDIWKNYPNYHGRIGIVAAKGSSYEALREPTFQAWHEDKECPDAI